jgi:hypothetical protein
VIQHIFLETFWDAINDLPLNNTKCIQSADFFISQTHPILLLKNTFKATCFGSTEPSSGLIVKTDLYPVISIYW